jgi:hypothetical protein
MPTSSYNDSRISLEVARITSYQFGITRDLSFLANNGPLQAGPADSGELPATNSRWIELIELSGKSFISDRGVIIYISLIVQSADGGGHTKMPINGEYQMIFLLDTKALLRVMYHLKIFSQYYAQQNEV